MLPARVSGSVEVGRLVAKFATRARHIDAATDRLIDQYITEHGRRASTATFMKLRAQTTLSTRPEKTVYSLDDLTKKRRNRAPAVLGVDTTGWARRVAANEAAGLLSR